MTPAGEDEAFGYFSTTSEFLEERGYVHYEVSNFARTEALISRHNHKYWDHTPYLGLGPALRMEALYFGFRTKRGIHGPAFRDRYGLDLFRTEEAALRGMFDEGLIRLDGDALCPTRRGLALADRLCLL
ncbi:MAG: hypothetical protein MUE57_00635 [Syntrophales bacterium]|nr:hypothetical protein [Syntrophales bacterium]